MYILFIDESGTPPANAQCPQHYFVIGGLIIPASEWQNVNNKLQGVRTRYGVHGEIKWRYFAPGNTDAKNPMASMSAEARDVVRAEVLRIITSVPSVKIIASVTSTRAVFNIGSVDSADDVYALTYKIVTERFQYFLQDLSKQTGSQECGMVVSDHRSAGNDRALRAYHHRLIGPRRMYTSKYGNFVETLFFAPSEMSTGIQLADVVAGSIWRAFEKGDAKCYRLIEKAIRKGPNGDVDGYGIVRVPKNGWV